jgi:hypothetical protein
MSHLSQSTKLKYKLLHHIPMYKNTNILETGKSAFYSAVDYVKDTGMKLGMVAALALPVAAAQTTQPAKRLHTQPSLEYRLSGTESCTDPFTQMTSPITPTGTVLKPAEYGNFTCSFQKHGSTHRYIGTTGNAEHNGFLLEYDGTQYQSVAIPLDSFPATKLQGGAQTIEGYILGAGTDLIEGKIVKNPLNQDVWQQTALIPLATGNDVMGVATFFYLNPSVNMEGRNYAVFVALANNGGIRRVVNNAGQLASIGSEADSLFFFALGSVELDDTYCELDRRMIVGGNDNGVIFKKIRADGTVNGMGVKDIVINLGDYVQGFDFGSNEFTAERSTSGRRYAQFAWQPHMLPIPYDPDTDGDGVPDSIDQCVNTVPNATVDAVGCPTPDSPFDRDDDGDIDHTDYELWEALATGPGIESDPSADYDGDLDADQSDFALLQAAMTGENIPFNPKP